MSDERDTYPPEPSGPEFERDIDGLDADDDEGEDDDSAASVRPPRPRARTTTTARESSESSTSDGPRPQNSCVIMGPTKVGKTMLLAAIQRACHQPGLDDFKLRFVAEGNTGSKLSKVAVDIIKERQANLPLGTGANEKTKEEAEYPFWIHATLPKSAFRMQPATHSVHMVVNDGPGGALFPAENLKLSFDIEKWQEKLVRDGLDASSIILCVDATKPSADLLESYLPDIIGRMSRVRQFSEPVPWLRRLYNRVRRVGAPTVNTYSGRCLNVNKFLLLLTKVDLICENVREVNESYTPERAARMLNPVEQARNLLGVHLLNTIHDALAPGAKFAVGVTSAWGFSPISKAPFASADGLPGTAPGETGDDILLDWMPFGIRDAMFFIATGECRGTVRRIVEHDIGVRRDIDPKPRPLYQASSRRAYTRKVYFE